jgi:hypothetical protein
VVLSVVGNEHHQQKDRDRDESKAAVVEDFARKLGFAFLPVP